MDVHDLRVVRQRYAVVGRPMTSETWYERVVGADPGEGAATVTGYVPELGQAAFGRPWSEFEVDDLGSACIKHVLDEISRVFWNRFQRQTDAGFQDESDAEAWNALGSGVEWHAYWWGDDDNEAANRPSLTTGKTEIRWYKYPGRGESVNRAMTPDDWRDWLNEAMRRLRQIDDQTRDELERPR